jgi:hypothetical protein
MHKWSLKKILLLLTLLSFAFAAIDREPTILSYMSLPVATILFSMFLIVTFLEKESALYEEQNRQVTPGGNCAAAESREISHPKAARPPTLSKIISHLGT